MLTLQQLAQSLTPWSLEELVEIANALLPQFLPEQDTNQKIQEAVNPRLVRHYTTLGVLDRPLKEGREARYCYRHLLQLLVMRRLLVEGYSPQAMSQITLNKTSQELEALLQGGVTLTVQTANPALAFLQSLKPMPPAAPPSAPPTAPPPAPAAAPPPAPAPSTHSTQWSRWEVLPGLELHIRDDFVPPSSPHERQKLLDYLSQLLTAWINRKRNR